MSLNKVILIGNVGKDPDVRYFDSGNATANFPLATSERSYKLANGTEIPERTEWHNIVATRDRAQFAEKYVKKGSLLYVEGKIRTRNYDDKDGNKRYITEIYVDRIEFYSTGSGNRRDEQQESSNIAGKAAVNNNVEGAEIPPATDAADDLPF
ncbi:MAG: single-stranded DNA-binding protein [Tannerella sp.]|jgi:single-strand DNA-binding protein|nr:single-stranded DNA-binding protein [Tannerella sp.]